MNILMSAVSKVFVLTMVLCSSLGALQMKGKEDNQNNLILSLQENKKNKNIRVKKITLPSNFSVARKVISGAAWGSFYGLIACLGVYSSVWVYRLANRTIPKFHPVQSINEIPIIPEVITLVQPELSTLVGPLVSNLAPLVSSISNPEKQKKSLNQAIEVINTKVLPENVEQAVPGISKGIAVVGIVVSLLFAKSSIDEFSKAIKALKNRNKAKIFVEIQKPIIIES